MVHAVKSDVEAAMDALLAEIQHIHEIAATLGLHDDESIGTVGFVLKRSGDRLAYWRKVIKEELGRSLED